MKIAFAFALMILALATGAWAADCSYSYEGATGPLNARPLQLLNDRKVLEDR